MKSERAVFTSSPSFCGSRFDVLAGAGLLGWLLLSAEGATIRFWGLVVPPLVAPSPALAHALEEWHEAGASLGYLLIGVHVLAALLHHYLRRDDTLPRMAPWMRPR